MPLRSMEVAVKERHILEWLMLVTTACTAVHFLSEHLLIAITALGKLAAALHSLAVVVFAS